MKTTAKKRAPDELFTAVFSMRWSCLKVKRKMQKEEEKPCPNDIIGRVATADSAIIIGLAASKHHFTSRVERTTLQSPAASKRKHHSLACGRSQKDQSGGSQQRFGGTPQPDDASCGVADRQGNEHSEKNSRLGYCCSRANAPRLSPAGSLQVQSSRDGFASRRRQVLGPNRLSAPSA